jgi:putative Mg2+ transporter-C (MgtC) family protein
MTEAFLDELLRSVPTLDEALRIVWRLGWAAVLGGVIGWQRQSEDKPAGIRTHVLVALGAALFVIVPLESGFDPDALSRIVQGVATGIGFIGAGAILKLTDRHRVEGLTTSATIWIVTAIGVAARLGRLAIAAVAVALAWVVLALLHKAARSPLPAPNRPAINARE